MISAPSSSFSFLISDRRVWLFGLMAALAVVLGFFAIQGEAAIVFVSRAGYWFVLAAFVLFVRALWLTYRDDVRALRWRTIDWASVTVVALGGLILLVHETFGFKILMDEIMLLGTSMSMHFDKTVLTPMRGNDIQGAYVILDGMMDKRPLFFPFLLSLVHDLTGYRPENAFVLNGLLTFGFLGLVNAAGRLLAGRLAGWIGVALFAGLPLLGQNCTGGGFELLNLVMILATLLLGARFIAKRDEAALAAFVLSGLLLAQVRYESMLYLVPVALIVLWVWGADRRVTLPWPVIVAPLLLVPYPLQHRIFELRASAWELTGQGKALEYHTPFSLAYVSDNIAHAAAFFFASPKDQPSSLVFSIVGWVAVPFALLLLAKRARGLRTESAAFAASAFFTIAFVAQFALMMVYFWGKFDDIVIRRLSLPTHLWLALSILLVLPQFTETVRRWLLGVAVGGLIVSGIPSMAAHAYSQEYLPGRETAWRREFIAEQPRRDYLAIDNDSALWVAHRVTATPILQAIKHAEVIAMFMKNRTFSDIYVFQRFDIDEKTGRMTLRDGDDLGPAFVLEPVREERMKYLTLSRLSRVKEIHLGPTVVTGPETKLHDVPKNRDEIEKRRREYLENYVRQLP